MDLIPEDSGVDLPPYPPLNVAVPSIEKCQICHREQREPLENHLYCKSCYPHMEQAYEWLQGKLVSEEEMNELQQRMLELTDIQNIEFD